MTAHPSFSSSERIPAVRLYDSLGWSILPVDGTTKRPLVGSWKRFGVQRASEYEIQTWSRRFPKAGIGVIAGAVSGLLILDIDGNEGISEVTRLGLVKTPMVRTPGGGMHMYFRHTGTDFTSSTKIGESRQLDVRSSGSYVVAPFTKRSDGKPYEWIEHPSKVRVADAPQWFLKMLKSSPANSLCGCPVVPKVTATSTTGQPQGGLARLPPYVRSLVEDGHDLARFPSRSECDFFVVTALLAAGFDADGIVEIFDNNSIGEKHQEEGGKYLQRTISLASEHVRLVKIQYADGVEYDVDGGRLYLCLLDESGQKIRTGITMPGGPGPTMDRWVHFFKAAGLKAPATWTDCMRMKSKLIHRRLRIEIDERSHRTNPVIGFHRV